MELKVVVTNPKTREEYDLMIDKLNQYLNEKYGGKKK
jgi:hypothetical protein